MTARQRGQPLVFLAMVIVLWIGARIVVWNGAPADMRHAGAAQAIAAGPRPSVQAPEGRDMPRGQIAEVEDRKPLLSLRPKIAHTTPIVAGSRVQAEHDIVARPAIAHDGPGTPQPSQGAAVTTPLPAMVVLPTLGQPRDIGRSRWSGDAWALVRSGGGTLGAGPGAATYGGNQIGGVLRYRLDPRSPHRPVAYLRANAALNGSGEREAALGLSVRPVASLPVILAAEGRVGAFSRRIVVRPAAMVITEFPPATLPGGARAEFYAQAGYVGGAGATPFADGQLRIDGRVAKAGPVELRAGAGAWGGTQRGAARFDLGPTATLGIASGSVAARIGIDWRFRLAGSAIPASGPALTVSAGF